MYHAPSAALLEQLLAYTNPKHAAGLAATLLQRAGSAYEVFRLPQEELRQLHGLKESDLAMLRALGELYRRYEREQFVPKSSADPNIIRYLQATFGNSDHEEFFALFFNHNDRFIGCEQIGSGDFWGVSMNLRRLAVAFIDKKVKKLIVSHNHPGNNPNPSEEDFAATRSLQKVCDAFEVELCDHIIISGRQSTSICAKKRTHTLAMPTKI